MAWPVLPHGFLGTQVTGDEDTYQIDRSLRFNSADSANLTRTTERMGNRVAWTKSFWLKRTKFGTEQHIFEPGSGANYQTDFAADDTLRWYENGVYIARTNQVFRDPTAWYHLVFVWDSSNATASDRFRLYVNGQRITSFSSTSNPSLNQLSGWNSLGVVNYIGRYNNSALYYLDCYLTEVHHIDGLALDASYFGETDSVTGRWKAKQVTPPTNYRKYPLTSGMFSQSGLSVFTPANIIDDNTGTFGFHTDSAGIGSFLQVDLGSGNAKAFTKVDIYNTATTLTCTWNVQYSDDATSWTTVFTGLTNNATYRTASWSSAGSHRYWRLYKTDAAVGGGYHTEVHFFETDPSGYGLNGYYLPFSDSGSASISALGRDDESIANYAEAKPILATNTSGSSATGGVNSDSGASSLVLALSMNGSNGGTTFTDQQPSGRTSGTKTATASGNAQTSTAQFQFYGSSGSFDGTGDYLTIPASSDFDFGTGDFTIEWWQYWNSISGFQTIWSNNYVTPANLTIQTGNGTGLHRIFLNSGSAVLTETSSAAATGRWYHYAVVRNGTNLTLYRNGVSAGSTTSSATAGNASAIVEIGGVPTGGGYYVNGYLQDLRVYKGLSKYKGPFVPPIRNSYTPNNIAVTTSTGVAGVGNDSVFDSPSNYAVVGSNPRGNYATMNDVNPIKATYVNGALQITGGDRGGVSTFGMTTGKWYCEMDIVAVGVESSLGVSKGTLTMVTYVGSTSDSWGYYSTGAKYTNGSSSAYGASFTSNDTIGCAFDADNGTLTFYKNGVSQGTAFTGLTSGPYFFAASGRSSTSANNVYVNFGQRPFAYTPPTDHKVCCTTNITQPTIQKPNSYFETSLYTGNGSTQTISGIGFQPDLVWIKSRSTTGQHVLTDAVRGTNKQLFTPLTNAEGTQTDQVTAFNSNGFSLGANVAGTGSTNQNTTTYVAWSWDENPVAGFDIVTYTGNGTTQNISHSLGVAPKMIIVKASSSTGDWIVGHSSLDSASPWGYYILLNSTAIRSNVGAINSFGNNSAVVAPTSTVFTVGNGANMNANGVSYVAYLFSEIEGFSKFGSYTGNGLADGPFVWCGFRPRWLLLKEATGTTSNWTIMDTARDTFNLATKELGANLSTEENNATQFAGDTDILSPGFKLRTANSEVNASGSTYIFAAFAEAPFKYARGG
jgi:hypothetical protein